MSANLQKYLIAALVAALALWAAVWWHGQRVRAVVDAAVLADRAQWQALATEKLAAAEKRAVDAETRAGVALLETRYAEMERERVRLVDLDRLRSRNDGLQRTLETLRRGGGQTGQAAGGASLSDAAPALATALSECSGEYAEVAAAADQVTGQLLTLQDYVREVLPKVLEGAAGD
jgi:hypothetical protein